MFLHKLTLTQTRGDLMIIIQVKLEAFIAEQPVLLLKMPSSNLASKSGICVAQEAEKKMIIIPTKHPINDEMCPIVVISSAPFSVIMNLLLSQLWLWTTELFFFVESCT